MMSCIFSHKKMSQKSVSSGPVRRQASGICTMWPLLSCCHLVADNLLWTTLISIMVFFLILHWRIRRRFHDALVPSLWISFHGLGKPCYLIICKIIAPSASEKDWYFPQFRCNMQKISVSVVSAIGGQNCYKSSLCMLMLILT